MIPIPSGVRVWIATGHTDMRRGMRSLALTVRGLCTEGRAGFWSMWRTFLMSVRCGERHFARFTSYLSPVFSGGDGLLAERGQDGSRATQIISATGQHDVRLVAREVKEAHSSQAVVLLEHGVRPLHG